MARLILWGNPISPGVAIGPLHILRPMRFLEKRRIAEDEIVKETESLARASATVRQTLAEAVNEVPQSLAEYREIMLSQMELARDPRILETARARIRKRHICASWALNETMEELCALFTGMDDPCLRDHAQDIKAICLRLDEALAGSNNKKNGQSRAVLAAFELSPADIMDIGSAGLRGLLTVEGGFASHAAILSRSMHVPAISGLPSLLREARESETVIVDGLKGCVLFDPDEADLSHYHAFRDSYRAFEYQAHSAAPLSAATSDGVEIEICANLENASELGGLSGTGARGVGLYRTEYAYLGGALPDEQTLVEEYEAVLAKTAPERVIFRTLDIGADKLLLPGITPNEPNPALGLRGIRFCLKYQDIFRTQLRAIFRAAKNGNAALMLPMISSGREIDESKKIIADVLIELEREGLEHAAHLPLGIMVETPAAVLSSDLLAAKCDFFSIGTNDLSHYLLAIDRNNRHVAHLNEPLHPAFIRCLKMVIDAAHAGGIPVSVCGELAADPFGIAILLGLGIDGLSAAPRFVPTVKHVMRKLNAGICGDVAHEILDPKNAGNIKTIIEDALRVFLGSELSFYQNIYSNQLASECE